MSENIGETYVTITAVPDEASIREAGERISTGVQDAVDQNTILFKDLVAKQQVAATLGQDASIVSAKSLIGQASTAEAEEALKRYTSAALEAARADVALTVASGVQSDTFAANIALLQKEQAVLGADTAATRANTGAVRENVAARRSFRETVRDVASGQQGLGSLFSPRFLAGGLAVGAVFQGLQHLKEGLKVTGDEAFTMEGKFRNAGAELLSGDLVAGFQALNVHAPTAKEQLEALGKATGTTSVDLRNFAAEQNKEVDALQKAREEVAKHPEKYGELGQALVKVSADTQDAAEDALALAAAYEASAAAVQSVNAAIAAAGGNDAAVFGERGRIGQDEGRRIQADPGGTFDSTATEENERVILEERRKRTKTLQDDLALAEENLREDEADFRARAARGAIDGQKERAIEIEKGRTEVKRIQDAIAADEARAAREREAAAKRAADLRGQQLRDALDIREANLKLALEEAQHDTLTLADDRAALKDLIAFEREKQNNRDLTLKERQAAAAAEAKYLNDLGDLNKQALADALGVKRQNLQNAIEAAKLTDETGDNDRADNAFLKFLKGQVERARKLKDGGKALADAKSDLIAFQLELKDAKDAGGGLTLEDLFAEAHDTFDKFGSNVSSQVTTGGGVRAGLAAGISAQDLKITPGQREQITEAQKTNQYLSSILGAVSRSGVVPDARDRTASAVEKEGPGAATAWRTRKLTGMLG